MSERRLSRGARRLRELVTPKPDQITQAKVAETLGVTQQAVSNWVRGAGRPEVDTLVALEREFGIPMKDWTEFEDAPSRRRKTGTDG